MRILVLHKLICSCLPNRIAGTVTLRHDGAVMQRLSLVLAPVLIAGAVACGGKGPTDGGTSPDVAGTWTYFEVVSDAAAGLSCNDQGTSRSAPGGSQSRGLPASEASA